MNKTAIRNRELLVGISILIVVAGCGDDDNAPAPSSARDGGKSDAARVVDSSAGDSQDAASVQEEDSSGQGYYQFGQADRFEVDIGDVESFTDQHGFDLAVGVTDFALAYENVDQGVNRVGRIDVVRIPTTGTVPKADTAVNADSAASSVTTEPAVVFTQDSGYHLAWSDDRSGRVELYSYKLGSSDAPRAITDTEAIERHVALTMVNSTIMAAWVAENATTGKRAIYTQLLGVNNSQPVAVVGEDAGREPEDLVLTHVGEQKAVLGWVDLNNATRGVYLQRLMSDGSADGEPQQVLSDPSYAYSGGSMDIAGADSGGAIVYSMAIGGVKQVRFMRIDAEGRLKPESELKLVAPPYGEGKDASLAKWGSLQSNQYLVAYRATAADDLTEPMIRTMAVDLGVPWDPSKIERSNITSVAGDGGRLTIRVANDGAALIVWVDAILSTKKSLHAIRLVPRF